MYNQLLEHYGRTHNFRKTKNVLKLMSSARPRVKPDVVTYGHVIHCFAHSKKPRSALRAFEQMRAQHIAPNGYTYMGVLRALAHMRDAFSAVQVSTADARNLRQRLPFQCPHIAAMRNTRYHYDNGFTFYLFFVFTP